MKKKYLIEALVAQLEKDLLMTEEAVRMAHDAATGEESKPENEYDTRAIEAGYLAEAQAKRAAEIDQVLAMFRSIKVVEFSTQDPIASTALIKLKLNNKMSYVLLMPLGGGMSTLFEGHTVQVITPNSHLGEALLGLKTGDWADVEVGETVREYEVLGVA